MCALLQGNHSNRGREPGTLGIKSAPLAGAIPNGFLHERFRAGLRTVKESSIVCDMTAEGNDRCMHLVMPRDVTPFT